jgi:hypothetical protein
MHDLGKKTILMLSYSNNGYKGHCAERTRISNKVLLSQATVLHTLLSLWSMDGYH